MDKDMGRVEDKVVDMAVGMVGSIADYYNNCYFFPLAKRER